MAPSGLINGRTGTTTQAFSEPVLLCGLWGPLVHCMIRAGSASGLPGSASPEPSQKQRRWYRDDAVTGGGGWGHKSRLLKVVSGVKWSHQGGNKNEYLALPNQYAPPFPLNTTLLL